MTKTFTTLVSCRFAKPALSVMIQLGTAVDILFVWDFEFGSLRFGCNLIFGAWNFHDFH